MGAVVPEALAAAARLERQGTAADVVCVTSPGLLFRALLARQGQVPPGQGAAVDPRPGVPRLPGHAAGHRARRAPAHALVPRHGQRGADATLGVTRFGQSGALDEVYRYNGIDADGIVRAALDLAG